MSVTNKDIRNYKYPNRIYSWRGS